MTRTEQDNLVQFDQEIERTLYRLNHAQRETMTVEDPNDINPGMYMGADATRAAQRSLNDYITPSVADAVSSIRRPPVQANNFEIKPAMIQMIKSTIQFTGHVQDDPNTHIANFLELCDTFKFNGVSDDAIRLRLFPFSLQDKAKSWLHSLPAGSITTWDALAQKFLAKYFPPSKTAKMRNDITSFVQMEVESLYEAWERFKELLRKCPHHQLPVWLQVQTFYNGLSPTNRSMIDAAAGGTINRKSEEEAFDLIDEMASNSYQWQTERMMPRRPEAVHAVDNIPALTAEIAALRAELNNLKGASMHVQASICELCGGGHDTSACQTGNPFAKASDSANYVGNFYRPQQNNPYSNTYNPGWRQHPNFY